MSTITILKRNQTEEWDQFVRSHSDGSIYQTSSWRNTIQEAYGHHPEYLIIRNDNGTIAAGLPMFLVKSKVFGKKLSVLPLCHFANPLTRNQKDLDDLINYIKKYIQNEKINYCEIKTDAGYPHLQTTDHDSVYFTHVLNISHPPDQLLRTFHKSCIQRPIKKSALSGIKLFEGKTLQDVKSFYHLYLKMRKDNGLLPQPFIFFQSLWKNFFPENRIEILLAKKDEKIISGILLLKYKKTVVYEYGATLKGYSSLHPSHFLLWHAIQSAHHEGYTRFDFGRTADDNPDLMTFKKRWGTEELPLIYHTIPEAGSVRGRGGMMKKMMHIMMKIMPEPVCRLIGRALYKNLV